MFWKFASNLQENTTLIGEVRFQISLRHGFSPVTLLHIFKITFPKSTSGRLLLSFTHFFLHFFLYSIETPTLIFKVISQKLGDTWRHLCWPTPYQLPSPFWRKTGLYWYKKKYRYTGHSLPMFPFYRRPKSSWRFLKYLTSLTFYYCIQATHKSVISFHMPDHRFMEL